MGAYVKCLAVRTPEIPRRKSVDLERKRNVWERVDEDVLTAHAFEESVRRSSKHKGENGGRRTKYGRAYANCANVRRTGTLGISLMATPPTCTSRFNDGPRELKLAFAHGHLCTHLAKACKRVANHDLFVHERVLVSMRPPPFSIVDPTPVEPHPLDNVCECDGEAAVR